MEENKHIDNLFGLSTYASGPEVDEAFYQALRDELIFHYEQNEMYHKFCDRKGFNPYEPFTLDQIPPVSVSVFKELGQGLTSVGKDDIKYTLQSSATSGIPSSILVDKETAKRQSKAMIRVIQEVIGHKTKPFLIMDIDPRSGFKKMLGARFAAVTGYLKFASKVGYFLNVDEHNLFYFNVQAMKDYLDELGTDQPVVLFGFTYILYTNVLKGINKGDIDIKLPKGSKIIHIGGWKKLESEKISKEKFNEDLAACFGIAPSDIIDIYGFTEQMGLNYPDFEDGWKHTSVYSRVIVRDVVTREILPAGKEGMLEFISPIPHSYPGNVVLTDDLGVIDPDTSEHAVGGTRFKILGRIKKAEVRGCGDILSSKLTFSAKKGQEQVDDKQLNVQFFQHEILGETSEEQFKNIIDRLNASQDWLKRQPVDALIGLISEAAKQWLADPRFLFLKDKGLLFLSQWCDERHLRQVALHGLRGNIQYADGFQPFADSEKHFLKANPRGLVCHWMAGNVQILGVFALVQCILTKNVNLIKVAAKDGGVFSSLMSVFNGLSYTRADGYTIQGDDLAKTIAVVYFSRHARTLGEMMSSAAKVRIAWGGKESVETVAGYPSSVDCETVIFGPKLSYAVIAKEELSSEQEAKKLARRVSVDVSVFDQAGCASPHNLYVERGGEVSPERFCEILATAFPKTELQIPKPTVSPEQISAIHSIRGVYDFKGKIWGSPNLSWTILKEDDVNTELHAPIYSRTLMVHEVNHINDALDAIQDYVQSIGIAAPLEKALEFGNKATERGVARLPLIGRMLNFEMPWDGIFLIDRLVKWNTLFGPLV